MRRRVGVFLDTGLGRRAGARVWRLAHDPEAAWVASSGPRQAHLDGFDLHANVWVPATNRARLEELCRYLLRPPVAQDRLRLTGDGRIRLRLKSEVNIKPILGHGWPGRDPAGHEPEGVTIYSFLIQPRRVTSPRARHARFNN